jgi:hypothetical protein
VQDDRDNRFTGNPVVRVLRWTVPWILVGVVGWYLWGFYNEFKVNARATAESLKAAEQAAVETTVSAETSGTAMANVTAIVLVDGVRLRTTPADSGQIVAAVGKDVKLTLIEKKGDWYRAKDPLGRIGWVSASPKLIKVETK